MELINSSALKKNEQELLGMARIAARGTFSDKGHHIGCVIKCGDGSFFSGATNIRSRTIGSTCAERMALDQVFFHKNRKPELCVIVGKLPQTKWRRKWSDENICTPCGVCLESFRQTVHTLGLEDIGFLCSSFDGKNILRAKLSELFPVINLPKLLSNKETPLFELVKNGNLPSCQFIDEQTIKWIEDNKPLFFIEDEMRLLGKDIIKRFTPANDWFSNKEIINSIHGLRHILRVTILAKLIAVESFYSQKFENLLVAAAIHDIRRENDNGDLNHGLRAAKWFKFNFRVVEKKFKIKFTKQDIADIYWIVALHGLPLNSLMKNKNYIRLKDGLDIIRIADALDRYRLPKIKWWINDKIIGYRASPQLKQLAFDLVVESEKKYLNGDDSVKSILKIFI